MAYYKNHGNSKNEFLVVEFKALRTQMDQLTKEILTYERWTLIVSGVIWGWLATNTKLSMPNLIYWSPAVITFLAGLRVLGLHHHNLKTGEYISRIENKLNLPINLGWENILLRERPKLTSVSSYSYWILLFLINVIIPLIYIPFIVNTSLPT